MSYAKTDWQNSPSTNTPLNAANLNHIEQGIYDAQETADNAAAGVAALQGLNYAPIPVNLAADMTDISKIYVYLGSEAGYTANHWYYWNGAAWTEGGGYNSQALVTDTTLSISGEAADAKVTGDMIGKIQSVSGGTDLNTLTTRGMYRLSYSGSFVNSPLVNETNIHKMLEVFVQGTAIFQRYSAYKHSTPIDYQEFFRIYDGSSWKAWQRGIGATEFAKLLTDSADLLENMSDNDSPASGTDLNTIKTRGFYRLSYGGTYVNSPVADETNKYKFLEVLFEGTQAFQRYTLYKHSSPRDYQEFIRIWDGTAWKAWTRGFSGLEFDEISAIVRSVDTVNQSFTASAMSSQGTNQGHKMRVLTYNLAQYNNDTATYIPDANLLNLRKALNKADADLACIQEDRQYIDSGNTKLSTSYVFMPKYSNNEGAGSVTLHSKYTFSSPMTVRQSGNRTIRAALITIDENTIVLAVSAHPIANYNSTGKTSAESIAMRETEYQELFEWCNGDISLKDVFSENYVYAPTHTHCIIGMDSNSLTADDKQNLKTLAETNDFVLGNGGFIGWFITSPGTQDSIDNIVVSDNIIINNIESWSSLYADLYSDHVPVVADVTLL